MPRGLRKRPVEICTRMSRIYTADNKFIRQTANYYVVTARLLGTTTVNTSKGPKVLSHKECGHKHRSEKGAMSCFNVINQLSREIFAK